MTHGWCHTNSTGFQSLLGPKFGQMVAATVGNNDLRGEMGWRTAHLGILDSSSRGFPVGGGNLVSSGKRGNRCTAHPFFPSFFPFTFALFPPLPPFESCSTLMLGLLFLRDFSVSAVDIPLFLVLEGDGWTGSGTLGVSAADLRVLGGI